MQSGVMGPSPGLGRRRDMKTNWIIPTALSALMLAACVEDSGGGDDDASSDVSVVDAEIIEDRSPEPEPEPDGTPEPEPDLGAERDMMPDPDARPPDMTVDAEPLPVVTDCASACLRLSDCDQLDAYGDYDGCLDACARASRRGPPEGWFRCIQAETNCGLVQRCRLPEPPPLTCDEVCAAVDGCGVELPFPDCLAECEQRNGADEDAPPFSACGEALSNDRCDGGEFWRCLGERVYTQCATRCDISIECNLERADGCLQACIAEGYDADPLARLRAEERTRCIAFSNRDCLRADACLNPEAGPGVVDRATLCAAWDRCAADFGFPCEEIWQIAQDQPGVAECIVEQTRNGCPRDPFLLFEICLDGGGGPVGPGCAELCQAQSVCEQLPAGQDQLGCIQACSAALQGRDQDAAQRQRTLLACGIAQSCDELAECVEVNSPLRACEAHCMALDSCGLGAEGCVEACDADFFRARQSAFRECIAAADDCEAMALCDIGQPIGCAERCARLSACGNGDPNCEAACDDDSFADPARAARVTACTLSAPLCFAGLAPVSRCNNAPDQAGRACLGFCRARIGCDPDDVDGLVACLVQCGEGFVDDEGLRYAEARACLEGADPLGACAPLSACIPEMPSVACPDWCGPLDGCGVAPEGCAEGCPDDPLSRLRTIEQTACLADAEGCEAVEACYSAPAVEQPEPVDPVELCNTYDACGFEDIGIPCRELLDIFEADEAALVCIRDALTPCPRDPFLIFELCLDGRQGEPEALEPCRGLCLARGRCDELAGSIRDCTADCVDSVQRQPNGPLADILACEAALSCPDLAACIVDNGPAGQCAEVCDAAAGCGGFPDVESCLDLCGRQLLEPITPRTYIADVAECLAPLADLPEVCAVEAAGCFEVQLGDCELACNAIIECGLGPEGDIADCIADCPVGEPIVACVIDALVPECDQDRFFVCIEQGEPPPDPVEPVPEPQEPPPDPER